MTKKTLDFFGADGCNYNSIYNDRIVLNKSIYNKMCMPLDNHLLSQYPKLELLLKEGKVFFVEDVNNTDQFDEDLKMSLVENGIMSCLVAPIIKNGDVVGFFSTSQTKPRRWTSEEFELIKELSLVAWGLVESIENERALKESKRKLLQLVEELKRAQEIRKRFISSLSHELRNPLATISLGLDLMDYTEGDIKEQRKTRETLKRQTKQLIRLVGDLLNTTRITENRFELNLEKIEVNTLLEEIIKDNFLSSNCKEIVLEGNIVEDKIIIKGDKNRLRQAIGNMLNNSFKFTPEKGRVTITLKKGRQANEAYISIKDTGSGIPPDMLERIFDPHVQVRNDQGEATSGLGIGLSIVKDIVESHKGSIRALSQGENMGTEMIIKIPTLEVKGPNAG